MLLFFGPSNCPAVRGLRYSITAAVRLKANIPQVAGKGFDSARARGYPRLPYKDGKL